MDALGGKLHLLDSFRADLADILVKADRLDTPSEFQVFLIEIYRKWIDRIANYVPDDERTIEDLVLKRVRLQLLESYSDLSGGWKPYSQNVDAMQWFPGIIHDDLREFKGLDIVGYKEVDISKLGPRGMAPLIEGHLTLQSGMERTIFHGDWIIRQEDAWVIVQNENFKRIFSPCG